MDMNPIKYLVVFLALIGLSLSPQANDDDLYQDLGGKAGIEAIVDGFVTELAFDQEINPFFKDSDIGRLREKLVVQFCMLSNGPSEYRGDSMKAVHAGMPITRGK